MLIIDDDDSVRASLGSYFEDSGWYILQSGSAEEGLAQVVQEKPDAAIIDIRLPGMDGETFIRIAHEICPGMAWVIYTGSREYLLPDEFVAEPQVCRRVFIKPCTDLATMEMALNRQAKRDKSSGQLHCLTG